MDKYTGVDSPEIMEICLNCKRINCPGECNKIREAKKGDKSRSRGAKYEVDGQIKTLKEWAYSYGIPLDTLKSRMKHMPLKKALNLGARQKTITYTAYGKTLTFREWGELLGVKPEKLRGRAQRGQKPEKVLKEYKGE